MDTRELDHTIKRARRNNIGDALRRSVACNPEKDALIFGERRWSYADLNAGANRVANALRTRCERVANVLRTRCSRGVSRRATGWPLTG